jgi:hypothetical protein
MVATSFCCQIAPSTIPILIANHHNPLKIIAESSLFVARVQIERFHNLFYRVPLISPISGQVLDCTVHFRSETDIYSGPAAPRRRWGRLQALAAWLPKYRLPK